MIVEIKGANDITFDHLKVGDYFLFENTPFLKIGRSDEGAKWSVVQLDTGEPNRFMPNVHVTPCDAHLTLVKKAE